jgi:hypothetical protein
MTTAELRRLARVGAETRLEALQLEISAIYTSFPELRRGRTSTNPFSEGVKKTAQGAVTPRRRRKMSASARKRIAEAQRKRWVEWRAKQKPVRADAKSAAPGRSRKKK